MYMPFIWHNSWVGAAAAALRVMKAKAKLFMYMYWDTIQKSKKFRSQFLAQHSKCCKDMKLKHQRVHALCDPHMWQ